MKLNRWTLDEKCLTVMNIGNFRYAADLGSAPRWHHLGSHKILTCIWILENLNSQLKWYRGFCMQFGFREFQFHNSSLSDSLPFYLLHLKVWLPYRILFLLPQFSMRWMALAKFQLAFYIKKPWGVFPKTCNIRQGQQSQSPFRFYTELNSWLTLQTRNSHLGGNTVWLPSFSKEKQSGPWHQEFWKQKNLVV